MSLRERARHLVSRAEYRLGGWSWGPNLILAAVAYVPLLLTRPGQVGADTKTYLYLDPARLLRDAVWMWDTGVGFGTVTHQNIGYLWPMGPWYWTLDTLGVPDWVAQRLWLGTLILAAGVGVRFLLRELRWVGPGATVAALSYALSPYLLHYGARISVILLPWAGLPWLVALASRSLRRGGWRNPALFALVCMTVGGINFTSLALVMVGPLLWFVHATFIEQEVTFRRALAVGARITLLTVITSLWWAVGLLLQGRYGIPILRYTETYEVVAKASSSTEILRGLGYWFFYGRDGLGPWIEPAITMVQSIPVLAVSFALPLLSLAAGVLTRFRHRVFFVACIVSGTLIAVGAHPWDRPSPAGSVFKEWSRTDLGLAFRSTPRAIPLIALGFAVFLAAGVTALARRFPGHRVVIAAGAMALIVVNQPGLFMGRMVDRHLTRDEQLPAYWEQAAAEIDRGDPTTRVYEFPGSDFASYRWGNTVDPITPGLIDRDFAARELIPYGSPASADLLNALDAPLQEGRADPASFVPMLRILGIGSAVFRADLQFERFRTPRPRITYDMLERLVTDGAGLGAPAGFGEPTRNTPVRELPLDDELEYGTPPAWPDPHPVEIYPVEQPRPMMRTVDAERPVVIAGSGDGVVAFASTSRLDPDRPILYAGSFASEPEELRSILRTTGAELVVTDTNRRRARRWGSVRENDGYTERADETPLVEDRADNRLELFEGSDDGERSVAEQLPVPLEGGGESIGATVAASRYGNPVTLTAGDRAVFALDGDPESSWKVSAFEEAIGQFLEVRLDEPVSTDHLTLLQRFPVGSRNITRLGVSLDGAEEIVVPLGGPSTVPPGERLDLGGRRTFTKVRFTVRETNLGRLPRYQGISEVGIAEIDFGQSRPVRVREIIRPPVGLLLNAGTESLDHDLSYVFTRRFAGRGEVTVLDEEPAMLRWVQGPVQRGFSVTGMARLSDQFRDEDIDRVLGWGGVAAGAPEASASRRLPGSPRHRASMAFDGRDDTYWLSPVNFADNQFVGVTTPAPHTTDRLDLTVLNGTRYSVPIRVRLEADGRIVSAWDLDLPDGDEAESRASTTLRFPSTTASKWRVVVEQVRPRNSIDWFSAKPTVLPSGVVEADLGVRVTPPRPDTPWTSGCRSDLLRIDGRPVPVEASGTVADVEELRPLAMRACGGATTAIGAGSVLLETTPGYRSGLHLDRVELRSAAGGAAASETATPAAAPGPAVAVDRPGRLTYTASVSAAERPYWLLLGQSHSDGWTATTGDGSSLGPPTLVNGFANGWLIDPSVVGRDVTITVEWTPQRWVWAGLALSVVGIAICLWLVVRPPRRLGGEPIGPGLIGEMTADRLSPFDRFGRSPAPHVVAALAVCTALASLVLAGPVVAAVLTVAMVVGASTSIGWIAVRLGCVASFGAAAAYVVVKEVLNRYVVDFDWPMKFDDVHVLGMLAIGLLAVDAVIEARRGGWRRRAGVDL